MSHVIALMEKEAGLGDRLAGVDVRETPTPEEMGRQARSLSRPIPARWSPRWTSSSNASSSTMSFWSAIAA